LRTAQITRYRVLVLFLVVLTGWPVAAQYPRPEKQAEIAEFIKANYTKYEYRIPMRDGVHLFTAVYAPKDASDTNPYPIMLERTPYSVRPYGVDNYPRVLGPSEQLMRSKYIFVYQDVRGRFMSEGQFVNMRPHNEAKKARTDIDESTDTYDSIDWLMKNVAFNNGKVGMWGISYPGFYVAAGMIDAHPALKAASPQAPINDWFLGDDFHHHGALWLPHFFNFISVFGQPRPEPTTKWGQRFELGTPDGYNFFRRMEPLELANENYLKHNIAFWDEVTQHPNYDAFWKARSLPQHLKNIKPAVMVVGGWFDAENLYGALHTYEATAKNNPAAPVTLVMGPWFHGGWSRSEGDKLGDVNFGAHTSAYYREQIEAPFFEYHLKGKSDPKLPAALVFETGSNQWRRYDSWPPKNALKRSLYFGPNGSLSFDPPAAGGAGFDEYVSDPGKPVPYFDKADTGMAREYMTADQRLQGRRTDVLVYQTQPLQDEVTLAGPVKPSLFVSTSGGDSDWVVKLIDVYPPESGDVAANPWEAPADNEKRMGEYEQLVRGEAMRGRFRNSYEKPEPFEPGKVTAVEFVEPDAYHTFRRGHRIMVQVQSSWFPLVDINPQKFVPNIYEAKPADFQKATERVYHSREAQSHVDVLVLGK
jgi:putative CocE/NonD family hydrolase